MKIGDRVKILEHDDYRTSKYVGKTGIIEFINYRDRVQVGFGKQDEDGFCEDWDMFDKKDVLLSPNKEE